MRVMDVADRARPLAVEVDVSPAYELLMQLCAFSHADECETYEVGCDWFERTRAGLSPDLLAAVEGSSIHSGSLWDHLMGLVYETPAPKDVPAFLAHLERIDPLELDLHLLGYYIPAIRQTTTPDVILRTAQGDAGARQEYLATLSYDDECEKAIQVLLEREPGQTKRVALGILSRWYEEVFRAREPETLPLLERDAAAKRRLIGKLPPDRLIDLATNGLQYVPEAGMRRVLLVPTVIMRPWVIIGEYRATKIFCYPVADENMATKDEPAVTQLVRLHKALGDERRLRILKRLATESCTLQEVADYLGIGKSLAHHHLVALRAAGLVRVRIGEDKRFDLRPDAIAIVSDLLASYLAGQSDGGRGTRIGKERGS